MRVMLRIKMCVHSDLSCKDWLSLLPPCPNHIKAEGPALPYNVQLIFPCPTTTRNDFAIGGFPANIILHRYSSSFMHQRGAATTMPATLLNFHFNLWWRSCMAPK